MIKSFSLLWLVMVILVSPCYPKEGKSKIPDIVITIELYERDVNGHDKPLRVDKSFMLKIEDEEGGSVTRTVKMGIASIDVPLDKGESAAFDYKEGGKIKFQVLPERGGDSRWKIVSPANGETYFPENINNKIKVVFERNYPLYAVQAISTENETSASRLRDRLNEDVDKYSKFCSKKDRKCQKSCSGNLTVYIEQYMAFNMPDNGFDHKVKIGNFEEKACAEKLRDRLTGLYKHQYGFFVTLKDEK